MNSIINFSVLQTKRIETLKKTLTSQELVIMTNNLFIVVREKNGMVEVDADRKYYYEYRKVTNSLGICYLDF
jgi:hypothetical protein